MQKQKQKQINHHWFFIVFDKMFLKIQVYRKAASHHHPPSGPPPAMAYLPHPPPGFKRFLRSLVSVVPVSRVARCILTRCSATMSACRGVWRRWRVGRVLIATSLLCLCDVLLGGCFGCAG